MARTFDSAPDFYTSGPALGLFRLTLSTFERLWPSLAVRTAVRLFLTPLPPKWVNRRRAWDAPWRIESWAFEDASLTVYSRPVEPHGPVVLLVHGWGGHAGQMASMAEVLAGQGMRPVILEMPAHGRSAGWTSTLPQFTRAIDYATARLREEGYSVRALVAHSLGATAAAYVASRGLPVERLVLLAPAASPPAYTKLFAKVFGLSERTRAGMQRRIEAREGILMPQFEPACVGPRIRVPTLVVHDEGDNINRFRDGQAFAHAIRASELAATQGLGHRRLLKDGAVLGRVGMFVR